MVSVGKATLRVPLSLFWSRPSSSNIYQDINPLMPGGNKKVTHT